MLNLPISMAERTKKRFDTENDATGSKKCPTRSKS